MEMFNKKELDKRIGPLKKSKNLDELDKIIKKIDENS